MIRGYSDRAANERTFAEAPFLELQRKLLVRLPKWGVCLPDGCSESGSCGLARLFLPDEIVAARGAALVYAGGPGTVDLAVPTDYAIRT